MRLLRFAGLFFILIVTFQFTNLRYFDRTKFSDDNLPNGSSKTKMPMSDSEKLEGISYVSDTRSTEVAEEESIGLGEEVGVIRPQKNDTLIVAGKDNEPPDLQIERVGTSNGSYGTPPSPDQHHEDLPIVAEDAELVYEKSERVEILESEYDRSVDNLSPEVKRVMQVSNSKVVLISEMMNLLHQSHKSHVSLKLKRPSAVDQELLYARTQIENPQRMDNDPLLHAPLYWNLSMFKRSYELMEKMLKVYIYREGKRPVLHKPVLKGIYASEGWFMKQLKSSPTFVTRDPRKAHLYYLPFSSKMLQETLYVPGSHSDKNLVEFLKNYLDMISSKYHYWNRTGGSDHFLVACHDWAPSETRQYMAKCIRALCNSDVAEGFVFGKDVSLPETTILIPRRPLRALGGKPTSQRKILAFFAGGMHGYVRPLLVQNWGNNRDPDMEIFSEITKSKGKKSYIEYMKSSKYCICPKGYEVNSPRVVEAVFYECVPVIISDNFVPPFFDVLNWESFAVFVLEKDIPELKNILLSIPEERYRDMQMRVKMVQKHFLWHSKPEKFDIFHMILHSIWYNRVFQS